jgi:hypothetical protein
MTVSLQYLLFMIELISDVTYAWPTLTSAVGCSLTTEDGTIHETCGSVPFVRSV